jgi:hypothetical protein
MLPSSPGDDSGLVRNSDKISLQVEMLFTAVRCTDSRYGVMTALK